MFLITFFGASKQRIFYILLFAGRIILININKPNVQKGYTTAVRV